MFEVIIEKHERGKTQNTNKNFANSKWKAGNSFTNGNVHLMGCNF